MKVIIFLLAILAVICGLFSFVVFAPYHFYNTAITEGISSEFLTVRGQGNEWFSPNKELDFKKDLVIRESENLWGEFHFSNFLMTFPLDHPIFVMIPLIDFEGSSNKLGAIFKERGGTDVVKVKMFDKIPLNLNFKNHSLFKIPYFEAYIKSKGPSKIWRDLFSRDISPYSKGEKSWAFFLKGLLEVNYSDLVYDLYILKLRERIFPLSLKSFNLSENSAVSIVNENSENGFYEKDIFYLLDGGFIYKIGFQYVKEDMASHILRNKILKTLSYKRSTEEAMNLTYGRYRRLTYTQRTGQSGMVYLYSAWSHAPEKEELLRQMIHFLERGGDNQVYLSPLYQYAYKLYGTNFSLLDHKRKETARAKVKRKSEEELNKEVEEFEKMTIDTEDEEFENSEKRIDFFLKKAKELKINSDKKENILRSH